MPITARVQNQADGNTVQPNSKQECQRRGRQTAPQVVEDLPAGQHRERILLQARIGAGNARHQPLRNLPIPANPTMPAAHIRAVAGGVFLVQLHIAQQPGPGVTPFQKIVAEDPVVGETPAQRPFECINLIDALADERAFTEQVLVNIGNGASIRIDAELTGAHARIPRPVRAGQAHRHPWLKNAVPRNDTLLDLRRSAHD